MNPSTASNPAAARETRIESENAVIKAVREISFGVVEVVVHDRRITEIRQTRRTRIEETRVS